MDPAVKEIVELLTYARTEFAAEGPKVIEQAMHSFDFRGRLAFPTGLVPAVVKQLESLGYTAVVTDHRQFGLEHAPAASVIERAAGDEQRGFLTAAAENPIGQIEVDGTKEAIRRAAQLYRLFPDAQIVIAVARRKRAHGLRRMITRAIGEPAGIVCGGSCPSDCRLTVATFAYLNSFEPREVHVLLLADAAEAGGQVAKGMIGRMSYHPIRVYALVRPNQRLGAADRLCLEAMAGQVIYRVAPPAAEVNVSVCPVKMPLKIHGLEGLERKRQGIWHNPRRNALVGRIAKAAMTGDLTKLQHLGVAVNNEIGQWLVQLPEARVFVLVESTEHARELQTNLPGWQILSEQPGPEADQEQAADAAYPTHGIITISYAAKHTTSADVLIAADGISGVLSCRQFPPPAPNCAKGRIILVDFEDQFDDQARSDSRRRFREYTSKGWAVTDVNPNPPITRRNTKLTDNKLAGTMPTKHPAVTVLKPAPTRGSQTVTSTATPTHTTDRMPGTPTSYPAAENNWASSTTDNSVTGAGSSTSRTDTRQTQGKSAHNRKEASTHT
jgi:hypothetical protein